jgi:hypothetical protein
MESKMDKYEQIAKMAEAAELLQQVARASNKEVTVSLQGIVEDIEIIADQIEEA